MAEFNPTVGDTGTPNFTNRSPEIGANRSFEALFSGIGDFIGNAAATGDNLVKNKITDDARYAFDSTNDEMNLSSDTTTGKTSTGKQIPADLVRSQEGLSRLAQAHMQEKVTPEYYYQRLAATTKSLRAKYPGYEKEVDDIIQSVTGTRPANQYRDALFANIQNEQTAMASKQDMFQKWLMKDQNMGLAVRLAPDLFMNPEKYSTDQAKAELMTDVELQQGRVQQAKNSQVINDADKSISGPAVSEYIGTLASTHIQGALNGTDIGSAQSRFTAAMSDGTVSPEEKAEINAYIVNTRLQATQDIRTTLSREGIGKNFTLAEKNKMVEDALAPLTEIEAMVNSDNISGAKQQAEKLAAMKNQATSDMFQKFPDLLAAGAVRDVSQVAADIIVQKIMDTNGGGLKFNEAILSRSSAQTVLEGKWSNADVVKNLGDAKGFTADVKERMIGDAIDKPLQAIKTGKLPPETVAKYVNQNYNENLDTLFNAVDASTVDGASQRLRLYQKMFDPQITKSVIASGDEASLRIYQKAAFDKAQSIPEFKVAAKELSTVGENMDWSEFVKVEYDPEANRMRVSVDQDKMGPANPRGYSSPEVQKVRANIGRLQSAVKTYNTVLNSMSPILEATGQDELKAVKDFTRSLSVNISGGDEKGFFQYIADSAESRALENDKSDKGTKDESGMKQLDDGIDESDDPIEWDMGNSEDVIQGVMDAAQGEGEIKGMEKANYASEGEDPEAFKTFDKGLAGLVSSNKRGYKPDLDNLQPEFKTSISSLQESFGQPLTIVSGYRDPARNAKAGGAKKSRHMHGDAIDIDVSGMSREERTRLIRLARENGFGGIGVYPNSLHIDKGRTRSWGPSFRNKSLPAWARAALDG